MTEKVCKILNFMQIFLTNGLRLSNVCITHTHTHTHTHTQYNVLVIKTLADLPSLTIIERRILPQGRRFGAFLCKCLTINNQQL